MSHTQLPPRVNLVRAMLDAEDGAAFVNRTKEPAPQSGEDYRAGYILLVDTEGINVLSTLPSGYQDRALHLASYAIVLLKAGFNVRVTGLPDRVTSVKVVSW